MSGMNPNLPIPQSTIAAHLDRLGIRDLSRATIREIVRLARDLEQETGVPFVHMEMGVPGLEPSPIGVEAEIAALRSGVARSYPPVDGIPSLKTEMARFVKNFIDVDVQPEGCVPTVGSMQGGMAAFMLFNRCVKGKDRILFIDPGFPVQKQQLRVLGFEYDTFDVYDYRGKALRGKLEEFLAKGRTSAILYSNPNNPSWVCLTEEELSIIGDLSRQYDVPVIEDLAYFAMDFRCDLSQPGKPPYQASVARYTDTWMMLISSSKAFRYAGQRIGCLVMSDVLFNRQYEHLGQYFPSTMFGRALIYGAMYALSSGVAASVQHGFAAMLKAANDGVFNFVNEVREYGRRAHEMKRIFTENGFYVVYDRDGEAELADGFYFTIAYPKFSGDELLRALLAWGITAISLGSTGSLRTEGLRACVSHVYPSQFADLQARLKAFHELHGEKK